MQTVYVDTLLCVNLFIDYLLLYILRKALRINVKGIRIIFGALLGAVVTLGVFLPFYTRLFSVFYRIITSVAIVITAYGIAKPSVIIIRTLLFLGTSISFSGITTLIWLIFKPDGIVVYNDAVYFDLSPAALILCTLAAFAVLSIYEKLKAKHKPQMKVHKVTVCYENNSYTFDSLVDTGCNLREPFSGLPVIIAEKELIDISDISDEKLRIVPFETIAGNGFLKAFKPATIDIDGKKLKSGCYIAISEGKLKYETKSIMGSNITEVI